MTDTFTIGQCKKCLETTALKNGYCAECSKSRESDNNAIFSDIPDFMKNIFNSSGK